MKTTVLVACLSAALMTSMAVANEPGKTPTASSQIMTAAAVDSDAIAFLTAVNDHEMMAAEMALEKNPSEAVAEYAQMLHDQHTSNQEKNLAFADAAGISANDSPGLDAMKAKSKAKRDELSALPDDAFETAFIAAMVQDHTEVLSKIDNELLPNATDPELAKHLRETRTHIAMHLEHAQELHGSLAAMR